MTNQILTRDDAIAHGLKQFFTGKPCIRGHISHRYIGSRQCSACVSESRRANRAKNPAKEREINRRSRTKNGKRFNETRRAKYAKDDERKAKAREQVREWRKQNTERSRQSVKEWAAKNPEAYAVIKRNRRARQRGAEGLHTTEDIARIREAQRDRCANPACRVKLNDKGHVDHIQPLARGGSNWPRNLQLLCEPCNASKHAKDPLEFMRAHGMLL